MKIIKQLLYLLVLLSITDCRLKRQKQKKNLKKRITKEDKKATFQGKTIKKQ